ncbi:hypothetical protein BDV27DRAFT_157992 [Aspergillus caelatus]|uniref:Zn(2)-C6 fungal-type domain-containing protein n=1 Tax=Aspergillus caelatus TaxID=61420 RepID=A0A5N7A360_9EURO|nr:uncharacterized protein BDV27DRAFT_157992 [Aspergillus caelatus]KAE8364262.1 hypothetical protein BDV27DRAFT_157992 [Aspergillus caelatus]
MVNAGRRSKCCFTCRQRRVKCDLQRPHCRRCTDGGRTCPGYPEPWDVLLRMQNAFAKRKVQTRVEKVMSARRSEQQERRVVSSIPCGVHLPAELYSWSHFYRDYAIDSGFTFLNMLPGFYNNSSSPCCQEALHAVTLASLARQRQQSELMVRARWHYGKAITALNLALNDPVMTADDSVLITLLTLSLFETIVPDSLETTMPDVDFHCHIHFRGTLLLLRWRAQRCQNSDLDKRVFAFFSYICFMSMFVNHESGDSKWSALEEFTTPWIDAPLLEPVLSQAVQFRRRARVQLTGMGHRASRLQNLSKLIRDGIHISDELETAATSAQFSLHRDQHYTAFNYLLEVSTITTEAIARSLYRTIRYHIMELVMGLIIALGDEWEEHERVITHPALADLQLFPHEEPVVILEQICEEICAVLGFSSASGMEENKTGMAYRSFGMFFPIVVLLFSSSAGKGKKVWLQEKLQFIGATSGLGLATYAAGRATLMSRI